MPEKRFGVIAFNETSVTFFPRILVSACGFYSYVEQGNYFSVVKTSLEERPTALPLFIDLEEVITTAIRGITAWVGLRRGQHQFGMLSPIFYFEILFNFKSPTQFL